MPAGRPKGSSAWDMGAGEAIRPEQEPMAASLDPWEHPRPKRKRMGAPRTVLPKAKLRTGKEPVHTPTDQMSKTISNMASYGLDVITISKLVDLSPSAIYRHYGQEMKTAAIKKDLMVMQSAFLKAVGGPDQDWQRADAAQQRWWIAVRQKWQPPASRMINANFNMDLTRLSDEQLNELERIMEAAMDDRGHQAGEGGALIEAEPGGD